MELGRIAKSVASGLIIGCLVTAAIYEARVLGASNPQPAALVAQAAETRPARGVEFGFDARSYRLLFMRATAYTARDAGMDGKGITFSGLPADIGAVAVDPDLIPLGSVVYVEGYGYAVALDTGSAIKGHRIDVYFHDVDKARAWGVREVVVKVFARGETHTAAAGPSRHEL